VRYLLDVSALLALGVFDHELHERVSAWVASLHPEKAGLATCSITELGFVRVLAQVPQYGYTVSEATLLLSRMKTAAVPRLTFINDNHDCSHLPGWVKTPKQITDGHLVALARGNGAVLATLDAKIRSAFLIPERS